MQAFDWLILGGFVELTNQVGAFCDLFKATNLPQFAPITEELKQTKRTDS